MEKFKKINKYTFIYVGIAIVALVSRLYYVSLINFWNFGHDVRINIFGGHSDYIKYLAEHNFVLPSFNPSTVWQFYHPPLHHYVCAIWYKITYSLGGYDFAFESMQILTTFYSLLILFFVYKILKSLNFTDNETVYAYIFTAFLPSMTLLAGNLNNDILCFLFSTIAIWFVVEWNKDFSVKNTFCIALFCGLATITKLSGLLLIPSIFLLFLYKFLSKKFKKSFVIGNFSLFSLVYFPIACVWGIRNYLNWKIPFFYVNPSFSKGHEITNFFTDRIFNITDNTFSYPFLLLAKNGYNDYNTFEYLLKSSVFSEYPFKLNFLSYFFFYASIFLLIVLIACIIFMFFKKSKNLNAENKMFFGSLLFVIFASFIKFQYEYPVFCSQNFRYIVLTIIISIIACANVFANCKNELLVRCLKFYILIYSIISVLFFAICTPNMMH